VTEVSKQILELFHAEACFVKNLSKRSRAKTTVVWHNHSRRRIIATENHVTTLLPPKYESYFSSARLRSSPETSVGSFI
jgi:hypothetical protein